MIIYSFGSGVYANTATGANIFVRMMTWLSPLHYGTELLLRIFLKDKNEDF